MKRSFLLKASTAHTAPDFDLRQVASTSGRLDIICRCIQAAFAGPKGTRPNVEFKAVLEGQPQPPLALTLSSDQLRGLPPDEEAIASWIFNAMQSAYGNNGIALSRESFEKAVRTLRSSKKEIFYLHEEGEDLEMLNSRGFSEVGFILGDQTGLDAASEKFLDGQGISRVSIGPRSYLSSSAIVFVNSFLDSIEG